MYTLVDHTYQTKFHSNPHSWHRIINTRHNFRRQLQITTGKAQILKVRLIIQYFQLQREFMYFSIPSKILSIVIVLWFMGCIFGFIYSSWGWVSSET